MKLARISVVLATAMTLAALALSGCGSSDDGSTQSDSGTTQSSGTQKKEQVTVGVALPDLTAFQGVYGLIYDGMKAAAAKQNVKLELATTNGEFTPQKYQNAIDDIVAKGVKVVTFDAYDPTIFKPVIKRLEDRGIKVVTLNPPGANETAAVTADTDGAVRATIKELVAAMGGSGEVGILVPQASAGVVVQRVDVAKAELKALGATVVGQASFGTTCSLVKGANATQDLLQAHPNIKAIFASCGQPGMGAVKAVQQSGKDVLVYTYDGSLDELKAVKSGTLTGTLRQRFAEGGSKAIEVLAALARGEAVEKSYLTGFDVVTKDNVDQFLK